MLSSARLVGRFARPASSLQRLVPPHSVAAVARQRCVFTTFNGLRNQAQKPGDGLHEKKLPTLNEPKSKPPKITPDGQVLHEDIYTLPNILTFTRLVAAPIVGYLVVKDYNLWAAGLFAYAGITDLVDGWIARKWNRKTVVGTVIDPMADKILMTILTVCLAVKGALPVWLATIILGRDAGLGVAAIYFRWISLPPPKTFTRYWDFSLPSAEVHPTQISKYNTFLQVGLIGLTVAAPVIPYDMGSALSIMQYVVAATTIWSGASYVYTKDAVKILNKPTSKLPTTKTK